MNSLSIVIPARNEEATIGLVLNDVNRVVRNLDCECETIVVDDHSHDQTAAIAKGLGANVIPNTRTSGKGNALRTGFEASKSEYILMMDADYSHRAEDIPLFLAQLRGGAGMVIGSRIFGGSDEFTRIRALGNLFLTGAFGLLHGRYLSDALNGFKAFQRAVFDRYTYTSANFEIEIELLMNAIRGGYRLAEVPSHERARAGGEAKSRVVRHGTRFLARIIWEKMRKGDASPTR